jgi:glucan endo-1,3-alpha-glucosidase
VAPPSTLNFFHSHRGATEMLKFFIAWYKTGSQPTIRKDALYWAYRTQLAPRDKDAHSIKLYGPVEDAVYVTANLTTGATLRVSFGSVSKIVALPAGSSDTQVPAIAGYKPHFELLRGTKSVAQHDGDDSISAKGPYPNFYYSTGFMY